ncbi:MAG: RIP metalloprotease RseP [Gammaproteobacteria bacterium]|nr:RIP metalloprotease RseP [Gammaproteobacteria bacterium]
MVDFLQTLLALLVALSLLIAIHELGHFLLARWCGVKVLRFSIGFGKPLYRRIFGADKTEFVLAAIPLGGYVKMLDEREGEVALEELPRAFNRQPLGKRSAIVAAGPLFNFIFAIVAYWMMFVIGVPGIKPLIDTVQPGTIAHQAGLRGGEEIIAVNGDRTPTWQAAMEAIIPLVLLQQPVQLTVFNGGLSVEKTLDTGTLSAQQKPEEMVERLGLNGYRLKIAAVIDEVSADSVAQSAGLRRGDEIRFIDDTPITDWSQLVTIIAANPDRALRLVVLREGRELDIEVRPRAQQRDGKTVGLLGVSPYVDAAKLEALRTELRYPPGTAVHAALSKTWDMSVLTLRMISQMITGRASVENISGPIGIAQYAKHSAVAGTSQFLAFLAVISLSLGVLNLLPIPVLDGGHLLFYLVELFKGSPVSEQTELLGQRVGMTLIFALMVLAIYNDLARLAG